jgi:hypothetical protein
MARSLQPAFGPELSLLETTTTRGKTSKRYEERFGGGSVVQSPPCIKTPLKQRDCKTTRIESQGPCESAYSEWL